jgi:hypothetical protein
MFAAAKPYFEPQRLDALQNFKAKLEGNDHEP